VSDRLLADALRQSGAQPKAVDWRDNTARWRNFDLAVMRSTWDYHLRPAEFTAWLDRVAAETRLVNSRPLLRWNSNKLYLAELRERGVAQLPFLLVEAGAAIPYRELDQCGWGDVVVKPLVGASAWQIARAQAGGIHCVLSQELQQTGYLIQPYACQIEAGEYSIIYFDGQFSHAVLKKPKPGDFRTQPELGATQTVVRPEDRILAEAASVLEALPERPTYARVDGIVRDGHFVLMEAELIEPELFLHLHPGAAQTFAASLLALVQK